MSDFMTEKILCLGETPGRNKAQVLCLRKVPDDKRQDRFCQSKKVEH